MSRERIDIRCLMAHVLLNLRMNYYTAPFSNVEQVYKYNDYIFALIAFNFSTTIKQVLIQHASIF